MLVSVGVVVLKLWPLPHPHMSDIILFGWFDDHLLCLEPRPRHDVAYGLFFRPIPSLPPLWEAMRGGRIVLHPHGLGLLAPLIVFYIFHHCPTFQYNC